MVEKVLGLPQELGVTLVFGFLRKELSLIMMLQSLGVGYEELMTVITKGQLVVFSVFICFFIPCVSTVAMLWKEMGRRIAMISMAMNVGVAIVLSFLARLLMGL
jgi:ferrous iron transport protein B